MKFIIRRTSKWDDDSPCDEAVKEQVVYKQCRTVNEKDYNKRFASSEGQWRSVGTNHKAVNKGAWICRDVNRDAWTIEIDDIIKFAEKYGQLVLQAPTETSDYYLPEIEIYDDYRE